MRTSLVLVCFLAVSACGGTSQPSTLAFTFTPGCSAEVMYPPGYVHTHVSTGFGGFDEVDLAVTNWGGATVRLTSVEASGEAGQNLFLPAVGQSIEPWETVHLAFGYSPRLPVDLNATVKFGVEHAEKSEYSVDIWGHVTKGLEVPASLDFGGVVVGHTGVAELLVLNRSRVEQRRVAECRCGPCVFRLASGNEVVFAPQATTRLSVIFEPTAARTVECPFAFTFREGTPESEGFMVLHGVGLDPNPQ